MEWFRWVFRYAAWPLMMFGFGGAVVWLGAGGARMVLLFLVLGGAVAFCFLSERLIPYQPDWNRDRGDTVRDWLHALVNITLNRAALWLLPAFAWLSPGGGAWPHYWPFALQVVLAVLVLDFGIAAAHHASHRFELLWRFHAVHHSPKRLYGFNGLMKHPVHQSIELVAGVLPLLLLGIPREVAVTLPFLVSITLLCQHSNADFCSGYFRYLFANAEVHRFHHSNDASKGDVNFGLFTNLYDHLAGTFHYQAGKAPRASEAIGIHDRPDYPTRYLAQLIEPFRALG